MLCEHPGDVLAKLKETPRLNAGDLSEPSLSGAVVDDGLNPFRMLPNDGTPEEGLICTSPSVPLVREAITDTRESDGVVPDVAHCELRPHGDLVVLRSCLRKLHDLRSREKLLDEMQGAVVGTWQNEFLEESL